MCSILRPLHGRYTNKSAKCYVGKNIWSIAQSLFGKLQLDVEPITLVDSKIQDIIKWQCFSDKEYGGMSSSEIKQIQDHGENLLRFSGNLVEVVPSSNETSTTDNRKIAKAGYCAVKGFMNPPVDLRDMVGFDMKLRSPQRLDFSLTMSCVSFFEKEIYQVRNRLCMLDESLMFL